MASKKIENMSAIFASGCFWGTEHCFSKAGGVLKTTVGYIGGNINKPSYGDVSSGTSGHVEAILVNYNPALISYEKLAKLFFETHDFEQVSGQGPDIGPQYKSKIFYNNENEKKIAEKLIEELENMNYAVATKVEKISNFWPAEEYHQDYYEKSGGTPYCHTYRKLFK